MAKRDVMQTLRDAESVAIRELQAIRAAIRALAGTAAAGAERSGHRAGGRAGGRRRKTRGWTTAQRQAAAARMRAYWTRRKAGKK
jgi:hypothetical protein